MFGKEENNAASPRDTCDRFAWELLLRLTKYFYKLRTNKILPASSLQSFPQHFDKIVFVAARTLELSKIINNI